MVEVSQVLMPFCTSPTLAWSRSRAPLKPWPVSAAPRPQLHSSPLTMDQVVQLGLVKSDQPVVPTRWLTTISAIDWMPLLLSALTTLLSSAEVP